MLQSYQLLSTIQQERQHDIARWEHIRALREGSSARPSFWLRIGALDLRALTRRSAPARAPVCC
jgi:hypothetical protein